MTLIRECHLVFHVGVKWPRKLSRTTGLSFHLHGELIYFQKLHLSHCRIEKTKANARTTVFWPGMNKHIEDMVPCCEKCLKYQSKQTKEPMQTREIAILPWQIVASDVLEHKNQNYLVVIDSYSKYIEAIRLNGKPAVILLGV